LVLFVLLGCLLFALQLRVFMTGRWIALGHSP
jgi:hypothetical protein